MLSYQNARSEMTLREAIGELRLVAGEQDLSDNLSPEMQKAIDAHDVVHVIFGCDTSERDEVVAHAYMLLGTTVKVSELKATANHHEHRKMASDAGHAKMMGVALRALPRLVKAIISTLRMKKRFPWESYNKYLDRRLLDIRNEFGIRVPV